MRELSAADRGLLARAVRATDLQYDPDSPMLELHLGVRDWRDDWRLNDEPVFTAYSNSQLESLGYVASSVLPRVGELVRLELKEFCTSAGRLALAKAKGCRWDEWTCARAAAGGHLEALTWAREHDCEWSAETCEYAAKGGHLEVLQWAREQGCPWNKRTCNQAALCGHLEVLRWAREHDCPWDKETCMSAAFGGKL